MAMAAVVVDLWVTTRRFLVPYEKSLLVLDMWGEMPVDLFFMLYGRNTDAETDDVKPRANRARRTEGGRILVC
jgi:hypothetical protein